MKISTFASLYQAVAEVTDQVPWTPITKSDMEDAEYVDSTLRAVSFSQLEEC